MHEEHDTPTTRRLNRAFLHIMKSLKYLRYRRKLKIERFASTSTVFNVLLPAREVSS